MTVSIVIPLFNRWDMTEACLLALANTCPDAEIITVDNGSTDETRDHDVTIRNPRNRGFAVACNQGARASRGDVIVFLNNDTEPQPGWLEPLAATLGVAGPKLIYPDGRIQSAGITVDFSQRPGQEAQNRQESAPGGPVAAVTGACLAITRHAYHDAGGFDAGYWNGYEDVDLCLTVAELGYPVEYVPESVVIHHESQSDRRERFRAVTENVVRLRQKWGTP